MQCLGIFFIDFMSKLRHTRRLISQTIRRSHRQHQTKLTEYYLICLPALDSASSLKNFSSQSFIWKQIKKIYKYKYLNRDTFGISELTN